MGKENDNLASFYAGRSADSVQQFVHLAIPQQAVVDRDKDDWLRGGFGIRRPHVQNCGGQRAMNSG
jgi:hypothetical protein